MKKFYSFAVLVAILCSCSIKEQIIEEVTPVAESSNEVVTLTYNLNIIHYGLDDQNTKAVKSGWEAGDVIYVFFSTVAAPKYLRMSYDGSTWSSVEMNGTEPESIGLSSDGTMTAVFLPFGSEATVSSSGSSFVFDQIDYAYYLSCTSVPYTVSGGVVSGTLNMTAPEGFVQFFFTDSEAEEGKATLREAHITPKAVTGVASDGTLIISDKVLGTQMPGYVYGTGAEKGYLFSGELLSSARGVSTDYHFNMVRVAESKVLNGTKTLYRGSSGSYTHRAIKFPSISAWSSGSSEFIEFADDVVKTICISNWDTSGDGELSYAEAAAISSLGTVFRNNKDIVSFEELRYFTGMTIIPEYAFNGCSSLVSVIIPQNIKSIQSYAFRYCENLLRIVIPSNVTYLGAAAFSTCSSLSSLEFEASNTSMTWGSNVFAACTSLSSVNIPRTVGSGGAYMFQNCTNLRTVTISLGNAFIADQAFFGCTSLESISVPYVTSIGMEAFYQCSSLTSISIPFTVRTIGNYAFTHCTSLASVTIEGPGQLVTIGNYAFKDCPSLTSLTIPNATRICDSAFDGCTNLAYLDIPSGVTEIGYYPFNGCSSLVTIILRASTPPSLSTGYGTFYGLPDAFVLYVPSGSLSTYQSTSGYSNYSSHIQAIP